MAKFNKDMTILEVINTDKRAAQVFAEIGMHCVGCAAARGETVAQAAAVHGVNADELVASLNALSESEQG